MLYINGSNPVRSEATPDLTMLKCLSSAALCKVANWTDAHVPRADRPVRFAWCIIPGVRWPDTLTYRLGSLPRLSL